MKRRWPASFGIGIGGLGGGFVLLYLARTGKCPQLPGVLLFWMLICVALVIKGWRRS